jgi:hypothetical protein
MKRQVMDKGEGEAKKAQNRPRFSWLLSENPLDRDAP